VCPGDRAGRTPLFLAVSSGSEDVVELLLNSGANITLKNKYKETPLHCCARSLSCRLCQVFCDDQCDFVPLVRLCLKRFHTMQGVYYFPVFFCLKAGEYCRQRFFLQIYNIIKSSGRSAFFFVFKKVSSHALTQ
jgi:hypothetical protein